METWVMAHLWPLGFLFVATTDDLLFKKFHNACFLFLGVLGLIYGFYFSPLDFSDSILGFLAGVLMLPLFFFRVLGAGDVKFMMVFGLIVGANALFWTFIYSLFWGAFMGLIKALLSGGLFGGVDGGLWGRMKVLSHGLKVSSSLSLPYTCALSLGWFTWV